MAVGHGVEWGSFCVSLDPRARIRIRERERARRLNGAANFEEKRENREMGWTTRRERKDSKRPGSCPDL